MKKNNLKYYKGYLAFVLGIVLTTSCQPEYEPEIYAYPEIEIDAVSPASGYPGTIVRITGRNFGTHQDAAHVSFNGVPVTEFLNYEDGLMEAVVPPLAKSGKISVQVWTHLKDSVASYTVIPLPIIESVKSNSILGPNIALPGDIITLAGSGFGTDASLFTITFAGDVEAEVILPVKDDEIKVIAPEEFSTGNVSYLVGSVSVVGNPVIINPNAPGDITPYFLGNTGDIEGGGLFVRGDGKDGRWGTLGAPWITNTAALNKVEQGLSVGGYGREQWNGQPGYIAFETWGDTPIVNGKVYQPTSFELPVGSYTVSFEYYSEIQTNSFVHCVVASGDSGIPSLADLSSSLGYVELENDAVIGASAPSVSGVKEFSFELETSQKVSLGFLANMKWNGADPGSYCIIKWIKLVKN
ncbi:DUF5013 domain-containing protein [Belliella marina]|uniref:DUF5013 domain-containing protein n=1 Tax=Belliella marina TaxID=1644146 RepID=A0ABW4VKY1_9BACT